MSANLAFILESPMQAWGASSRFGRRDTLPHPTKSGVLGMVAAALGIDKFSTNEAEQLAPLRELKLNTYAVPKVNRWGDNLPTGRLQDFHTIGGGYDKTNANEKPHIPCKAAPPHPPFGTVITRRDYLTDARFLVILSGDSETLKRVNLALRSPVWGSWLGRKCCIPSVPIQPVLNDNIELAAHKAMEKASVKPQPLDNFDRYLEQDSPESFLQRDQPKAYASRNYQSRPARHLHPKQNP